jgi:predicted RNA-binding Zn-ribbon protein involved in translation (DUF1610 family)
MTMGIFLEPMLALLAIFLPILGCYALIEMQMSNKEIRLSKAIVSSNIRTTVQRQIAFATDRANPARSRTYAHICPACGRKHFVNESMQRVAYGRQYACSPDCDIKRRRASGSLW